MRSLLISVALIAAVATPLVASDLHWHSHSTKHFTFIYRAPHQAAVDELVSFADEVYAEVTRFFGSDAGHVPAVVFGETDLATGYYSPAPPQHIGLLVVQPSLPWVGAGTESWLRLLLVHELTHYVQANYDRGFFRGLGTMFGRSLSGLFLGVTPRWTTEGLAVNTETIYTGGGRGRNPFFEMLYKAPVVEDELFSLWQAGYDSHLAPHGRHYVAGYFIWNYLLDEYGAEIVPELFATFARFPLLGIRGPIRRTTGDRMSTIYRRIAADLMARYERERREEIAPRISPRVRSNYYLPVETERGLFLYRTRPDAAPAIVRFDPKTGVEQPVLRMPLTDHASWSVTADGRTLVFATVRIDGTFPDEQAVYSNLAVCDVDTGRTFELTSRGGYYQPAISPDGAYLVAVERVGGYQRLVRFDFGADADDPTPRSLLELDEGRFYTPIVSPNGKRIAVVANQRGIQQILVLDPFDGSYTRLPQPPEGFPYYPTFADDEVLLYGHDAGGALALYRHDLSSGETRLLARDRIAAYAGAIVGDELVFGSYTSDGYTLRSGSPAPGALVETITAPAPEALAPPAPVTGTRYRPFPAPTFWLPALGLAGPGLHASGLGAGATVVGSDILHRNAWAVSAVYFPALTQADYSVLWSTHYGRVSLQAGANAWYQVSPVGDDDLVHTRTLRHSASISHLQHAEYRLGVASTAAVELHASHFLGLASETPFAFGGAVAPEVAIGAHRINVETRLTTIRTPLSSRRAFHIPWQRSFMVGLSTPLEAPAFEPQALVARTHARLNVGLGSSDHVVSLAPAASYATTLATVEPFGLRGFGSQAEHPATGRLRGRYRLAVEYHTPHLLVDLPVLPSVGITGLGLSLFAEGIGGYDVLPARHSVNPTVGVGMELTAVITYWTALPFTLGVAARVQPERIEAFSFPDDLAVYLRADLVDLVPLARLHRPDR